MKLESKYFDSIRVKPKGKAKPEEKVATGTCQWRGCENPATNRAPRGRGHEGEYLSFCINHVQAYNKSYNYFSGMSDEEFIDYQKSASTGHRPTWTVSSNGTGNVGGGGQARRRKPAGGFDPAFAQNDPHGLFGEQATPEKLRRRPVRSMERKALSEMHLPEDASKEEIKARFKELVKRHHPDSNGGDRGAEDKLREVIQAYNYLKKAGLC